MNQIKGLRFLVLTAALAAIMIGLWTTVFNYMEPLNTPQANWSCDLFELVVPRRNYPSEGRILKIMANHTFQVTSQLGSFAFEVAMGGTSDNGTSWIGAGLFNDGDVLNCTGHHTVEIYAASAAGTYLRFDFNKVAVFVFIIEGLLLMTVALTLSCFIQENRYRKNSDSQLNPFE